MKINTYKSTLTPFLTEKKFSSSFNYWTYLPFRQNSLAGIYSSSKPVRNWKLFFANLRYLVGISGSQKMLMSRLNYSWSGENGLLESTLQIIAKSIYFKSCWSSVIVSACHRGVLSYKCICRAVLDLILPGYMYIHSVVASEEEKNIYFEWCLS
jgi:hypothetical protein